MLATSNKIKALLFYRFRIKDEESPGFIRFDESLDIDWFEQLGAEKMGRTYQRGQLTHTFKPVPGRRNEALDCMAYNVAALAVLNVRNWDLLEKKQNALSRHETAGQEENQANEELSIQPAQKQYQMLRRRRHKWVTGVLPNDWVNRWRM